MLRGSGGEGKERAEGSEAVGRAGTRFGRYVSPSFSSRAKKPKRSVVILSYLLI